MSAFAFVMEFPVMMSAQNEPTVASGMVNIITAGVRSDSNTAARIMYMRMNAAAMSMIYSLVDDSEWTASTATPGGIDIPAIRASTSSREVCRSVFESVTSLWKL